MTTAGDHAVNAARALRLTLASLRANEDTDDGFQVSRMVFDEIDRSALELVTVVLAHLVAKDMACAHGRKKASRKLEKRIARLLDFAAGGAQGVPPT